MYRADRSSKVFFRYTPTQDSINSIVTEKIRQNLQAKQLGVLDGRNMLGYKHGKQWRWGNNRDADQTSAMQSISAEYSVHQDEIVNHNTHIIQDYVSRLSEQLFGAFMKGLYEMVEQSAKEIGTSINANDYGGDFVKGFLEVMQRIEFGVDRYGRATPPELHVGISAGNKIIQELQRQSLEDQRHFEETKKRKETAATAREADRISRYRWKHD